MASYVDIRSIWNDVSNDGLKAQVEVATVIAAEAKLSSGTATALEQKWAGAVLANTKGEAQKAMLSVIASNKDVTIAQMQGASDAAVQAKVDAVVDGLIVAYNG